MSAKITTRMKRRVTKKTLLVTQEVPVEYDGDLTLQDIMSLIREDDPPHLDVVGAGTVGKHRGSWLIKTKRIFGIREKRGETLQEARA